MRIILFGPPAAGKGTQAKTLSKLLGISHIASGDLFRNHQRRGSKLGLQIKEYMNRGVLVPDIITTNMILERLSKPDCHDGFILDGYPRTLDQVKALDKALSSQKISIDIVINIKVSIDELIKRISGRLVCRGCQTSYHRDFSPPRNISVCDNCGDQLYQREDDSPNATKKRLLIYKEVTEPLIDYYHKTGKLKEVQNGDASIKVVLKQITKLLNLQNS